MIQAQRSPLDNILADFNPKQSLLFASGHAMLMTRGLFARVSAVADDPSDGLQRQLANLFREAKSAGIERPIVAGSIPFDQGKPSCLIIPEDYHWTTRPSSAAIAQAPAPATTTGWPAAGHDRQSFERAVRELLQRFEGGLLQKAVLSRTLDVSFSDELDLRAILAQMFHTTPTGYHFSVPVNEDETLIGVSPELLLRKNGDKIVSNPLAGSIPHRKFGDDEQLAAQYLLHSPKDQYEHRLVIDEMRDILTRYCRILQIPAQPSLLRTTNLWHLSTVIEGVLQNANIDALTLARALHPTPAVCGYPRELARQAISSVEGYDRGLFTGMTGWMDSDGNGEWVVTIRCGLAGNKSVRMFAGAGIVQGSVPELEWAETSAKMMPMMRAFGLTPREGF